MNSVSQTNAQFLSCKIYSSINSSKLFRYWSSKADCKFSHGWHFWPFTFESSTLTFSEARGACSTSYFLFDLLNGLLMHYSSGFGRPATTFSPFMEKHSRFGSLELQTLRNVFHLFQTNRCLLLKFYRQECYNILLLKSFFPALILYVLYIYSGYD